MLDEIMNYIRNHHDIPIHIIGYDRDAEIEKRKKQALKRLDEYPNKKINPLGSGEDLRTALKILLNIQK